MIRKKVNSLKTLEEWQREEREYFLENKYINCTASDRRSLDMNALVNMWYKDISEVRGDVTAKDVQRECKVNYGTTILRREAGHNWVYKQTLDLLTYEQRIKAIDCYAVTSVMSTAQLREYIGMMENDHPYLECKN